MPSLSHSLWRSIKSIAVDICLANTAAHFGASPLRLNSYFEVLFAFQRRPLVVASALVMRVTSAHLFEQPTFADY